MNRTRAQEAAQAVMDVYFEINANAPANWIDLLEDRQAWADLKSVMEAL